ncbi:MAG: ABC transporter permease subunit [Spirochaetaceae bacterium]|nr:ABC transporter permease subunit [Spirochaetaceae bacterium]
MGGHTKVVRFIPQNVLYNVLFAAPVFAAVTLFFVLPYAAALAFGFCGGGVQFLRIGRIAGWTVIQALLSTLLALVLGLPGAYFASSPRFKYKAVVRSLSSIPFALPPLLMGLGFVLFWGNSGIINNLLAVLGLKTPLKILYRPSALIFCHASYNFPLIMRIAGDAFAKIRAGYTQAAFSLGAGPFQTALSVSIPLAIPHIISASMLVFLYCFTSFSIALLLGGAGSATLAVEIYRFARITLDFHNAGALSGIETGIAALAFLIYLAAERKSRRFTESNLVERPVYQPDTPNYASQSIKAAYFVVILILAAGPIFAIAGDSFFVKSSRAGVSDFLFANYTTGWKRMLSAAFHSTALCAASAALSCVIALLAAGAAIQGGLISALTRWIVIFPIASSGIALGFGAFALYGREVVRHPVAAVVAHAIISLPFAYSSIYAALSSVPRNTLAAAAVFGANPLRRILQIGIPLCSQGIRTAWAFSACISLGEFNALIMLGIDSWETLPLYIYRAAAAYRYGAASSAGVILILLCFFALRASEKSQNTACFTAP